MILGVYELGKYLSKRLLIRDTLSNISYFLEFQYCTIGLVFLLILLFPLTAFTNYSLIILRIIGFILILFGLKFFFSFQDLYKKLKIIFAKEKHFLFYTYLLLMFLYFFSFITANFCRCIRLSCWSSIKYFKVQSVCALPEWFGGLQAGIGAVLISLGFSLG